MIYGNSIQSKLASYTQIGNMIDGESYVASVKEYFSFLISEFSLSTVDIKMRGNTFYDVEYRNKEMLVSISYENIEDYFQVNVYLLDNEQLPDYDDKIRRFTLSDLNTAIINRLNPKEIKLNNEYFKSLKADGGFKRILIKSARELRLALRHLAKVYKR